MYESMALLKGLSFVSLICLTHGYYYVTLPKYVSPGTPLSVVAHVTQTGGPVSFLAKIVASNNSDVASVRKNIVNDAAESLQIVVPSDLPKDDYKIVVSGSGGLFFHNESKLFYEENILIFIQTDKARYSGGQQVKYRAVFLLPTLANFNGSAVISFYDGNGNRIETRGPTAVTDGVIGGALDLSREPVFGDWKIEVKVQQTTISKQFRVFDYILPKFSVDLVLPQNIKYSDQSITISVEARYTFNKEVIGTCTIQIYDADYQRFKVEFEQEIRGTTNFTIAMDDLSQHNLVYGNIKIRAFVTDNATALTMAAETDLTIDVQKQSFWEIKQILDREGFFPGLTYSTIVRLTNNDGAPHRSGVFRYTATFHRVDKMTCPAGSFHKEILNVTRTHLNGTASYDTSGFAVITFLVPSGPIETIELSVKDRYTGASMHKYLKSFSRYSFPLLRVWTNTPDVMVGDIIDLLVESTEALVGNVTMEFYSRGMMIRLIQAPASNSRIIGINVPISADMFPRVFLMVSHITQSGHILSDNVVIQVQGKPLINKVEITYNTTLTKPRQSVDMKVKADRGSTVYISIEDERNRLLGSDNDIYANEVIDEVRRVSHNTSSNLEQRGGHKRSSTKNQKIKPDEQVDRNRREYGLFGDTDDGYMQTGLILLTDGKSFERRDVYDMNIYSGLSYDCYEVTLPPWDRYTMTPQLSGYMMTTPAWPTQVYATGYQSSQGPSIESKDKTLGTILRSKFPETWIWEKHTVGASGEIHLTREVPDSMTSWITSVFATNDQSGFGIAENITKVTVQNEFFITMDLPETIVQGEEFLLQVTVFNYLPSTQQVSVQIQHSDDMNHPIPAATITMVDSIGNTIDSLILLSLQLQLNSGEGKSTFVHFTPTTTGRVTITAEARAGDLLRAAAVDKIQKQVNVVPYGILKRENVQELVNLTHLSSQLLTVSLQDPQYMAPGSKSVTVKMTGNLMKPSIDGLQRLLKMPHGCGEQNMVDFAPDVYIAKYLKTVGKLTKDIEDKAVQQVKFGYQNELRNMHQDGSFSAFGESDLSGSTWLTAFVLKCFGQARSIVNVDDQVLSRSMVWLLGQQDQDGSFREPGKSMRWVDQSGTKTGVSHTAFILIAMLENRGFKLVADSRLNNAITKAMHYLEAQINGPHNMYTVAVLCYAMAKSGSSISPSCFNKLQTGALNQGDKTYWQHSRIINKRANSRTAPSRAPSRDIEATSYALLTYSELGKLNEGRKVVNWLVSQRNPSGGFASTQDTVVSLQALSEFAARFPIDPSSFPNYGLHLNTTGNNFVHEYQITPATYDTSYSFEVPSNVPNIAIYTTGEGVAVIDVTTSYYIQSDLQDPRISISATIIKESLNSLTVHNCMRWTGQTPSGMLLMEVERPTGFMTDVDKLNAQTTIKRQERNGRFHVLYFDSLAVNSQVCVDVKMDRSDPVVKSQACHVMVYDYYEPSYQAVTTYESGILKSTTICQVCPLCAWCNELSFPQIGVGR